MIPDGDLVSDNTTPLPTPSFPTPTTTPSTTPTPKEMEVDNAEEVEDEEDVGSGADHSNCTNYSVFLYESTRRSLPLVCHHICSPKYCTLS